MNQDLQNALAFYQAPPQDPSAGDKGVWLWLWETLQGDFHEDPSTAQVVTGTLISMIPFVDQIGDVRDLVANCRKVNEDSDNTWSWVALVLTLIGLVPTFGSLLKGCFKILFLYLRKYLFKMSKSVPRNASLLDVAVLDRAMVALSQHLDNPAVRKTLAWMKIYNPYLYLAGKLDEVKVSLTVQALLARLDDMMRFTREMFDSVVKWGPDSLKTPVERLWNMLVDVREKASVGIGKALEPAQRYLDQLGNRLRVEGDNAYRARPGNNTHVLGDRMDAELKLMKRKKPDWVDEVSTFKYSAQESLPDTALNDIAKGWPDISANSKSKVIKGRYDTFDWSMEAATIPPGERIYRVVDPKSNDNSYSWLREVDFKALQSKSQWRRELAVWKNWNENGEFIVYTVPPDKPLKVWQGRAATQEFKPGSEYKLEGGRQQIVPDPAELSPKFISPRQATGWGYDDATGNLDLDPLKPFLGLPELKHNWYQ